MKTSFAGEIPLDQIAAPRPPVRAEHPVPARVEVTQPYIPAIRDRPPEFAKRLNPDTQAPPPAPAPPATRPAPATPPPVAPEPAPPENTTAAENTTAEPAPKRRSLMRRVVRRIIGPDLLRKDPAPRRH